MTPKETVIRFFQEGYTNRNFDFVMECVAENYIDHSPAGAKSNADAVGILKIVAEQYTCLRRAAWWRPASATMASTGKPAGALPLRLWKTSGWKTEKSWNPGAIGQTGRSRKS